MNKSVTWLQSSSEARQQGDGTVPEPQEHCLNGGVLHQEADPDAKPIIADPKVKKVSLNYYHKTN